MTATTAGGAREASAWLQTLPDRADLQLDSRGVRQGDVFVGIAGEKVDARRFIAEAFRRGARAALVDDDDWPADIAPVHSDMLRVKNLKTVVGSIAAD